MKIAIIEKLIINDQIKVYVERDYEVFIERIPNLAVEYFVGNKNKLRPKTFLEKLLNKKYRDEEEGISYLIKESVKYALNIYEKEIKKETIKIPN